LSLLLDHRFESKGDGQISATLIVREKIDGDAFWSRSNPIWPMTERQLRFVDVNWTPLDEDPM